MSTWKKYKLEDLALDIAMGPFGSNIKTDNFKSFGVPVIRGQNLGDGGFEYSNFVFISEEKAQSLKRSIAYPNELVFTHRGTLGQVGIIPKNKYPYYLVSQSQMRLAVKKELLSPKYLFYFFKSAYGQRELMKNVSQVGVPAIASPTKSLKDVDIIIPDLQTQTRIASILSSLDDKIELNRRMNQTLEQMAQALFNHYFVDNIDPDNLPEGWKNVRLSEIVEITSSKRIFLNEYVSVGVPFYRGKEIIQLNRSGLINTELFIEENKFKEIKEKFGAPKSGDILITSVGTIGIPYLVDKSDEFYFKDGNLTWIKNYLDFIGPYYLYQWLISDSGQQQIKNITIGSTQKAITIVSLKGIRLLIPPKELHDQVSIQLQNIRKKIVNNVTQIKLLSKFRDTLLPKLMSGEIDVDKIMDVEQLIETELADCKTA